MTVPSNIKNISINPASNDPQGSENIGNNLDNYLRSIQAILRQESLDKEWITPVNAPVYSSGTAFIISGQDVTGDYSIGRRVKAVGDLTGTLYGKISNSVFTTDTTVTIIWDSGSLQNESLSIYLASIKGSSNGALSNNNRSVDFDNSTLKGSDIASASTIDLDSAKGNIIDITGTTDISTITLKEGRLRIVRFTGALNLINGSNLNMPNAANLLTAAGDFAIFVGYASNITKCLLYFKATGNLLVSGNASESAAGIAEIATQAETNAGIDDQRFITPLKLKNAPLGGLINMQIFTSSGTYTKTSNATKALVELVGGGGGGWGANGSGGVNGGNGGTTSFGSHASATGGSGGQAGNSPGNGGSGSLGDININGSSAAILNSAGGSNGNVGLSGGDSLLGSGGRAVSALGAGNVGKGNNGNNFGGGGAGGNSGGSYFGGGGGGGGYSKKFISSGLGNTETVTIGAGGNGGVTGSGDGGNGAPGIVIVYEYS